MALDAKVITYWHNHGIDLLILTSIAAAENLCILLKNETKPWLREAAIVAVRNPIEQRFRARLCRSPIEIASHAGHDALLQAIYTRCYTLNRGSADSRRF